MEIDNLLISDLQEPAATEQVVIEVVPAEDAVTEDCDECDKESQDIEEELLENMPEMGAEVSVTVGEAVPGNGTGSYIETVTRKVNILRGHTRAVVNDAVNKSQM